jgi:hypothetical protein
MNESITSLTEQLDNLFIEIGGNPSNLKELLEQADKIENQIETLKIENWLKENPPLSIDAWVYEKGIERDYERLHEEYGDAACLYSEYKEYRYQEYLENYQQNARWSWSESERYA